MWNLVLLLVVLFLAVRFIIFCLLLIIVEGVRDLWVLSWHCRCEDLRCSILVDDYRVSNGNRSLRLLLFNISESNSHVEDHTCLNLSSILTVDAQLFLLVFAAYTEAKVGVNFACER